MEDRYHRAWVNRSNNRKDTPLEEAVALMVRERLTGEAPPTNAKMYVDLWRPWIEEKAANRLSNLGAAIHDQAAFARLSRDIIAALDMADELVDDPDEQDESESDQEQDPDGGERQESPDGEEQASEQSAAEDLPDADGDTAASETESQQTAMDDSPDDSGGAEQHEGDEPW